MLVISSLKKMKITCLRSLYADGRIRSKSLKFLILLHYQPGTNKVGFCVIISLGCCPGASSEVLWPEFVILMS